MNLTEEQLRSWRLRRPAAKLKRRLFAGEPGEPSATWFVGWLVPATACALFTLMVFKSDNSLPIAGKPVIGLVLSNQNYAAFASNGAQNEQNHLSGLTFDWTNRSFSTSSISFTPSGK
jgi:hypothetical protein